MEAIMLETVDGGELVKTWCRIEATRHRDGELAVFPNDGPGYRMALAFCRQGEKT